MIERPTEELAKLHCLIFLFAPIMGRDLYYAEQIKAAIEFSLTGSICARAPLESFTRAAIKLTESQLPFQISSGFGHLDLGSQAFSPLWVRNRLIRTLKSIGGYSDAMLYVIGLRAALCPKGKYWTPRIQRRYEETIAYIDQLAAKWCAAGTRLTVIYL